MTDVASDSGVRSGLDALTAWLESHLAFAGTPGVPPGLSIGIVHDQRLIWARGFAYADAERKIPATAIMQLRDAGKLRLDDPVTTHLPWFAIKSEHTGAPRVTVRHLITHTSGLPREAAFPYWMDANFPDWQAIKSRLCQQSQIFATETRWKYSNFAPALAGEVVSALMGES